MLKDEGYEKARIDKKRENRERTTMAALMSRGVSTDISAITMNTITPSGGKGIGEKGGTKRGCEFNTPSCTSCGLYHDVGKGAENDGCIFWNPKTRVFGVSNFIKFKSVRQIAVDGTSSLSPYWKGKLETWAFRVMQIRTEEERKKVIDDINIALSKQRCRGGNAKCDEGGKGQGQGQGQEGPEG
jgi:hypothetical protein